jgi:8-oxo-dGTP pyrophosphatase MutT (NUDIX family)
VNDERSGPAGAEPSGPRQQYAALPYRGSGKRMRILLISSRETRRWVIPKGWPMKKREPPDAAAREALEEAGVEGDVERIAFGAYTYVKRLAEGEEVLCVVDVFPLRVTEEGEQWPEQDERTRRWFAPEDAAAAVDEPELKALIRRFAESPSRR